MESREVRRNGAANRLDSRVFHLDIRCDKRCSMCCINATPSPRAADLALETIAVVARQIRNAPAPPLPCSRCHGALGNVGVA